MAASRLSMDSGGFQQDFLSQFQGLDMANPAGWPIWPKRLLCVVLALLCFAAVAYFLVGGQIDDLEARRKQEQELKAQYQDKYGKVVNLEPLRQQRQQAEQYVAQLEKQLPGKAEMDALLSDINQAGVGRNLQFETFKPANEEIKNYYAVLPVAIRVSGGFPEVAGFASDIAHLSRIVTLNNISIDPAGNTKSSGTLQMQATANTYRYLDKSEMPAKKSSAAAKGGNS